MTVLHENDIRIVVCRPRRRYWCRGHVQIAVSEDGNTSNQLVAAKLQGSPNRPGSHFGHHRNDTEGVNEGLFVLLDTRPYPPELSNYGGFGNTFDQEQPLREGC